MSNRTAQMCLTALALGVIALAAPSPAEAGDRHRHRTTRHLFRHLDHVHRVHCPDSHRRHAVLHGLHLPHHAPLGQHGWERVAFGRLLPRLEMRVDSHRHHSHR
jgi:hypothetical protein